MLREALPLLVPADSGLLTLPTAQSKVTEVEYEQLPVLLLVSPPLPRERYGTAEAAGRRRNVDSDLL